MHILAGLLAVLAAVYFFVIRARGAAQMTEEVFDAANDVRLAARRFQRFEKPLRQRIANVLRTPQAWQSIGDALFSRNALGFRRRTNEHPVEAIEDPDIAIAGIAAGFIALDDLPTREQRAAFEAALAEASELSAKDAAELAVLGHWLVGQCNGPDGAVTRMARKLYKMRGAEGFEPLMHVIKQTASAGQGLSDKQREALEDIQRAFRLT